jgi:putative endonuclease
MAAAGNKITGNWGEETAAAWLQKEKKFRILGRNLQLGRSEVDILAMDGDVLVFVEVKVRKDSRFGHPEESAGKQKAASLRRAADRYIEQTAFNGLIRFDVVAITGTPVFFDLLHLEDFI